MAASQKFGNVPECQEEEVKPIALSGIHEKFYDFFLHATQGSHSLRVLDVGAGHGAFTKRILDNGHLVDACDLFPAQFKLEKIECRRVDITKGLPFQEDSYDVVVAVEIMEHVLDHEIFFSECHRILKADGKLLISTPNILSLKSRARFLLTGFFYSFKPLDHKNHDGLQHVSSLSLEQYRYLGCKYGFQLAYVDCDKKQNSSIALLWLWPLLWAYSKIVKTDFRVHNQLGLLLGRIIFLGFEKMR